jgi:uncharacterized protein (TIGR00369 family)
MTEVVQPVPGEVGARERTYRWDDPLETAAAALELDGLSFIEAMRDGRIPAPPIAATLGFTLTQVSPGHAVFQLSPADFHYNPIGSVHGGVYATLLDSAAGCALQTTLPVGSRYTSLDLTVKFLRGIQAGGGTLSCEGTLLHRGRRTALAQAQLTDEAGRLYAHATSSLMIFDN